MASAAPASASRRAGPMPSARSRSVVGHRQIVAPAPPSSATSSSVRCVAWIAVKCSPSAPASASSAVGVRPCRASVSSFSFGCSETCACSGRSGRPLGDHARSLRVDRADAVDGGADPRGPALGERVDALDPRSGVAVAEALDPAVQVARVEQRDPQPGRARGGEHRAAHRVRILVGRAVGRVVQVVELADAGDPGERHLAERGPREREARVGIERARQLVHLLAPGPERALAGVRATAQRALERVRVRVGEPGQREPAQLVGVVRIGDARRDRGQVLALDLEQDPRLGCLAAEPGELAPEPGHSPSLSTISRLARTPREMAVAAPRSRTSSGPARGRGTAPRRGGRPRAGTCPP